jgi:hypothetical protein
MRNGRMLAEDEPSRLLTKYNQTSLENVFLHLCLYDQNHNQQNPMKNILEDGQNTISNDVENQNISPNGESPHSEIRKKELVRNPVLRAKRAAVDCCICPHMHKIYALMVKDLTVMKRSIGFLIFEFLIPVIQIALFCLCIGRDPQHIPMALYNSEAINGFPTGNLSSELLNKISPNHIHFTPFNDFNHAIEAVRQGHYWGVAAIRRNFSQAVKNKSVLLLCVNQFSFFFFEKINLI